MTATPDPADGDRVAPTLVTDRLVLRPFRDSDLDAYAAMVADPAVARYLGSGEVLDRVGAWYQMAMFVGHWALRGFGLWAAEDRRTGALAGRIGLWKPQGWPGLEAGWMLAPPFWGRGLATEGARATLDFAFSRLGAEEVISVIHPDNTASIRVAERLGETYARSMTLHGCPAAIYTIGRERYRVTRPAHAR